MSSNLSDLEPFENVSKRDKYRNVWGSLCSDSCVHLSEKGKAVVEFYRENKEWFPEATFVSAGLDKSVGECALLVFCGMQLVWWVVQDGQRFVQWLAVHHWLKCLQMLAADSLD